MGEEEQRHRVVLLGGGKVGKSSLVRRFLHGGFLETYRATVEDLHCKDYNINGTILRVDILDTAGHLVFPAMKRLSISTAHAFVLVYSISDASSFDEVKQLREQIKEQRDNFQDLPCVIVGNKCDLEIERQISTDEATAWAVSQGIESAMVEASARDDKEIMSIFQKLLEQAKIPELRQLEPILKRRLSANASHMNHHRQRLKEQEESKLSRSRSLIRRSSRPKMKHTGDPSKNDCTIC